MPKSQETLQGYTRSNVPLKLLESAITISATAPLAGYLSIFTEDGLLRLEINGDIADDLRIDLNQFLANSEA